jgi:hypothetical protein
VRLAWGFTLSILYFIIAGNKHTRPYTAEQTDINLVRHRKCLIWAEIQTSSSWSHTRDSYCSYIDITSGVICGCWPTKSWSIYRAQTENIVLQISQNIMQTGVLEVSFTVPSACIRSLGHASRYARKTDSPWFYRRHFQYSFSVICMPLGQPQLRCIHFLWNAHKKSGGIITYRDLNKHFPLGIILSPQRNIFKRRNFFIEILGNQELYHNYN